MVCRVTLVKTCKINIHLGIFMLCDSHRHIISYKLLYAYGNSNIHFKFNL